MFEALQPKDYRRRNKKGVLDKATSSHVLITWLVHLDKGCPNFFFQWPHIILSIYLSIGLFAIRVFEGGSAISEIEKANTRSPT